MSRMISDEVLDRLRRLEIPFNAHGVDPYGISLDHLARVLSVLRPFYRHYFRVRAHGLENVPPRGRAMLVGNHAGGVGIDAAMVVGSLFFDLDPPRLGQGMADKFINRLPFASLWSSRTGQLTGLPEHAERLLSDERILIVFPEGARGTAKLFRERHSLVHFGTGFLRLALRTRTPIVPFAFLGGGEALPTVINWYGLGELLGVPYIPITPYLLPLPLPAQLDVHYGTPMLLSGTGDEDDETIGAQVDEVKATIEKLIEKGRQHRRSALALVLGRRGRP